jgi:hypothetical protein
MAKKIDEQRPRWLIPFVGTIPRVERRGTNVFGKWAVVRWPEQRPEAPSAQYVAWWYTDHVHKAPPQPTLQQAIDQIPITN